MNHTYVRLPTKILGMRCLGLDLLCSSTLFRNSCRSSPSSSWIGCESLDSFFDCCCCWCCCITRGIFTGRKSSSSSWSDVDGEEQVDGCCRLVPPGESWWSMCVSNKIIGAGWLFSSSSSLMTMGSCAGVDDGCADCKVANVSWISFWSSNCCFSSCILSCSFSYSLHATRGVNTIHVGWTCVCVLLFTQCCA